MATVLLIGAMLVTVAILVVGVITMARGGEANRKYSNKIMVARVVFQAIAVVLVVVVLMLKQKQG